jgi:hypothetical protein
MRHSLHSMISPLPGEDSRCQRRSATSLCRQPITFPRFTLLFRSHDHSSLSSTTHKSCSYLPQNSRPHRPSFHPTYTSLSSLQHPHHPQHHDAVLHHLRCPRRRVHRARRPRRWPRRRLHDREAGDLLDPRRRRGAMPCALHQGLVLRRLLYLQVSHPSFSGCLGATLTNEQEHLHMRGQEARVHSLMITRSQFAGFCRGA